MNVLEKLCKIITSINPNHWEYNRNYLSGDGEECYDSHFSYLLEKFDLFLILDEFGKMPLEIRENDWRGDTILKLDLDQFGLYDYYQKVFNAYMQKRPHYTCKQRLEEQGQTPLPYIGSLENLEKILNN